jgi:alpha/beta hydrolase family protein
VSGRATLRLRGGDRVIRAETTWPARAPRAVLVVLATTQDALVAGRLAEALGALALTPACATPRDARLVLEWTAEHADDLGAGGAPLLAAGVHAGGGVAALLAIRAGREGWPPIAGQVLVHPRFTVAAPPDPAARAAPAVIAACDGAGRGHADALRRAGVRVTLLERDDPFAGAGPGPGAAALLDELAAAVSEFGPPPWPRARLASRHA